MEFNQESNDEKMTEGETSQDKIKQWFQDNLRIIISVLIVVLIAGGIYSYSKRTQAPTASTPSDVISEETSDNTASTEKSAAATTDQGKNSAVSDGAITKERVSSAATSQETETSFVETAGKGDGMTTLARKSLANYLEKNPDSALTAEHKIYIEDYLRKHVTQKRVFVGTSVEFSKDLVKTAIESSKTLTPNQLNNLHKYAVRVPSLS